MTTLEVEIACTRGKSCGYFRVCVSVKWCVRVLSVEILCVTVYVNVYGLCVWVCVCMCVSLVLYVHWHFVYCFDIFWCNGSDEVFLHYALVMLQLLVYRCMCPVQSIEFGMYGFISLFSKETKSYMPLLYPSNSVVLKKMHFYWDSGFGK